MSLSHVLSVSFLGRRGFVDRTESSVARTSNLPRGPQASGPLHATQPCAEAKMPGHGAIFYLPALAKWRAGGSGAAARRVL